MAPMSGRAISESLLISPKSFIATSSTAAVFSFFNSKRVKGRPIRLLKLPVFFRVLCFKETMLHVISFVVVFPFDPVIAATFKSGKLIRQSDARSPNALSVEETCIKTLPFKS